MQTVTSFYEYIVERVSDAQQSISSVNDYFEDLLHLGLQYAWTFVSKFDYVFMTLAVLIAVATIVALIVLIIALIRLHMRHYDEKLINSIVRITKASAPEFATFVEFNAVKYGDIGRADNIRKMLTDSDPHHKKTLAAHALGALRAARSDEWDSAQKILMSTKDFEDDTDVDDALKEPLQFIKSRNYTAYETWVEELSRRDMKAFSGAVYLGGGVFLICVIAILSMQISRLP